MIINPLSQHPITLCDKCHKHFESGDDIHVNDDYDELCDDCWHEEENHEQCDECGEWIEGEAYLDDEDSKCFCNQECHVNYYSAKVENAKESIE